MLPRIKRSSLPAGAAILVLLSVSIGFSYVACEDNVDKIHRSPGILNDLLRREGTPPTQPHEETNGGDVETDSTPWEPGNFHPDSFIAE